MNPVIKKHMNKLNSRKKYLCFSLVLLLAFIVRAFFITNAQSNGGDWPNYERFAVNILQGNGFSLSDPGSSVIVPSSGSYYPGFPAFIALLWLLFGKSVFTVLWAQLILYILALYWLLTSLLKLTGNINLVTSAGILFALSPLTVGWSRFPLTESLAITASTWFLAEIINSLAQKKLRIYPLALALATSIYIRPDTVLLAIALLPVSLTIYKTKSDAIKQIVLVTLLTSLPVTAWMVRNVFIGKPPLSINETATHFPIKGYYAWVNTWAVNEYERADAEFYYPKYTKYHVSKFLTEAESRQAQELIAYRSIDESRKMAEFVDARFQKLADQKRANSGLLTQAELITKKSYNLLFNPFSSWGLPLEVGYNFNRSAALQAVNSLNITRLNALLSNHKAAIFGKLVLFLYRGLFFASFLMLFLGVVYKSMISKALTPYPSDHKVLILASSLVMVIRLAFFVSIGYLESRYLVEVIPWVECTLGLWILSKKFV